MFVLLPFKSSFFTRIAHRLRILTSMFYVSTPQAATFISHHFIWFAPLRTSKQKIHSLFHVQTETKNFTGKARGHRERLIMESFRRKLGLAVTLIVMLTLTTMAEPADGAFHKVGGRSGWIEHANYTKWSSGEHFSVGDWLCALFYLLNDFCPHWLVWVSCNCRIPLFFFWLEHWLKSLIGCLDGRLRLQ